MVVDEQVVDDFVDGIADHSYNKHGHEFRNETTDGAPRKAKKSYGDRVEVHNRDDLSRHVKETLADPDTRYVVDNTTGRTVFFNEKSGTVVIFNPGQLTEGDGHAGSVFREKEKGRGKIFRDEVEATKARMGTEPEIRNASDGKWAQQLEPYKTPISRGAEHARRSPPLQPGEKLPQDVIDQNRVDVGVSDQIPHAVPDADPDKPKGEADVDIEPKPDAPDIDTPEANTPDADTPKPNVPDVDTPKVDASDIDVPKAHAPDVDVPKVNVDVPSGRTVGRVADTLSDVGKRGGPVVGVVVAVGVGVYTLVAGGSVAQAAEVTFETAVPFGETMGDVYEGDMEAAARSGAIELGGEIGGWGGVAAGAAIGTLIFPGVGTVVGGIVGGVAGGFSGSAISERVYDIGKAKADNESMMQNLAAPGLIRELSIENPRLQDYRQSSLSALKIAARNHMGLSTEEFNNTDFSDPKMLRRLEQAIGKEIKAQQAIFDKHNTWYNRNFSAEKYSPAQNADARIRSLEGVQKEIESFKKAVDEANAAREKNQTTPDGSLHEQSPSYDQLIADGSIGLRGELSQEFGTVNKTPDPATTPSPDIQVAADASVEEPAETKPADAGVPTGPVV